MKTKKTEIVPAVPTSFFSSLTTEQQKQLTQLLKAYQLHYANYYSFSGETIKKQSFVFSLWRITLQKEVIEADGMTVNMFNLLCLVYFLQMSPKNKDTRLTKQFIYDTVKDLKYLYLPRLRPRENLRHLVKYGYLNTYKMRWGLMQYFVTDKSIDLFTKYSLRFQEYYNLFFAPLNL